MPVRIHFLNVARGDCTVIEHASGRLSVIDINNSDLLDFDSVVDSSDEYGISDGTTLTTIPRKQIQEAHRLDLADPLDYLARICPERIIDRYVQTHAHLDHMRGLGDLLRDFQIASFWDTDHDKVPALEPQNQDDWTAYDTIRSGAAGAKVFRIEPSTMLAHYDFWTDHVEIGDGLQILSPSLKQMECSALADGDLAEASIVLRLTHASRHVMFGAAAGHDAWDDMVHRYGMSLECDVLKASRQGRDSGFHPKAVNYMKPKYTVTSVGNSHNGASTDCARFGSVVYSTRSYGNLMCTIDDDGQITWATQYAA